MLSTTISPLRRTGIPTDARSNSTDNSSQRSSFRVRGTGYHLTYKHHISHQNLAKHLRTLWNSEFIWCSIVWENGHGDGSDTPYEHTHCAFVFPKAVDIRRPGRNPLDIQHEGEWIHGNYKPWGPNAKAHQVSIWWDYHAKDPVHRTIIGEGPGNRERDRDDFSIIRESSSAIEACRTLGIRVQNVSDVMHIHRIKPKAPSLVLPAQRAEWKYTLGNFTNLLIIGSPGCGKSWFAADQFINPAWCNTIDDLRGRKFSQTVDVNGDVNDGIVFDDFQPRGLTREAVIALLQWDSPATVEARYSGIHIPAKTRKIFTSNKDLEALFGVDIDGAITRRLTVVRIPQNQCMHMLPPGETKNTAMQKASKRLVYNAPVNTTDTPVPLLPQEAEEIVDTPIVSTFNPEAQTDIAAEELSIGSFDFSQTSNLSFDLKPFSQESTN